MKPDVVVEKINQIEYMPLVMKKCSYIAIEFSQDTSGGMTIKKFNNAKTIKENYFSLIAPTF